jgi:hypothetical protein
MSRRGHVPHRAVCCCALPTRPPQPPPSSKPGRRLFFDGGGLRLPNLWRQTMRLAQIIIFLVGVLAAVGLLIMESMAP